VHFFGVARVCDLRWLSVYINSTWIGKSKKIPAIFLAGEQIFLSVKLAVGGTAIAVPLRLAASPGSAPWLNVERWALNGEHPGIGR